MNQTLIKVYSQLRQGFDDFQINELVNGELLELDTEDIDEEEEKRAKEAKAKKNKAKAARLTKK